MCGDTPAPSGVSREITGVVRISGLTRMPGDAAARRDRSRRPTTGRELGAQRAEVLDDERVVVGLREARNPDGADHADTRDRDREDAPVGRVERRVEASVSVEVLARRLERLADAVRRPAVPARDARLALEPPVVVGARARKGRVEDARLAEGDADHDRQAPLDGGGAHRRAEPPRVLEVEPRQDELALLGSDAGEDLGGSLFGHTSDRTDAGEDARGPLGRRSPATGW